jgi:hypothetical protein
LPNWRISRIAAELFAALAWSIELTIAAIRLAAHSVHIAYISGTGDTSFPQMLLDAILVQLKTQ